MHLIQGSLLAHPSIVAWRNRLRGNPLLHGLYRVWAGAGGYEERFGQSLLSAVRPGDVVWDVGANVGHYSEKFLACGAGAVVCFEPAPAAITELETRLHAASLEGRARIVPVALAGHRGKANFMADGASPVNRIGALPGSATVEVQVMRGDQAMGEFALPHPDLIKVDVEGYEDQVIDGLAGVLTHARLRAVFVEVHFALLHERGADDAPARIVSCLGQHGFRARWIDGSHLAAVRDA